MPSHFIINNNGYRYEAWYEPGPHGKRKMRKRPIHNQFGRPVKRRDEAILILHGKENGAGPVKNPKNTTIGEFTPVFRQYLIDKGKKDKTIRIYTHDVAKAKDFLPLYLQDVELSHIEGYIGSLNLRPATKTRYAKSLSRFFSVAKRRGLIAANPIEGFEFQRQPREINPYSEGQIKKLIQAAKELGDKCKEPYYTFIIFALQAGLRLDEYVNLRWKYLDLKKGIYTICPDGQWRPKHDHKRAVIIPRLSLSLLDRLSREGEYIFHKNGRRHHHFTRDFVNAIFKAAGVVGDLHQIRKTCASYRLACGEPMQNVKAHLGHRSLEELEAYIGVVANPSQEMRRLFDVNTK